MPGLPCSPSTWPHAQALRTPRYWTHVYAGGPVPTSGKPGAVVSGKTGLAASVAVCDEIAIAGLDRAHVEQFEAFGFELNKVVRFTTRGGDSELTSTQIVVLRRLSYRGANVASKHRL